MRTVIRNGTVVTSSDTFAADVWIENGVVAALVHPSQRDALGFTADRTIDATGKLVMPGGIDAHTHLDMPFGGTTSSDDFETGTIAAAHGGTTTIVDFAIQTKGQALRTGLDAWHAKAEGKAAIDYGFHMIVTDVNDASIDEMGTLVNEGITSFKLFMAYPGVLYVDDGQILRAMQKARDAAGLICMHAENGIAIDVLVAQAIARGETAPKFHSLTRPQVAEAEGTHRAICLAEMAGAPVYIVHLSAPRALDQVVEARDRGLPVYAETCPQYLFCSLDDLARDGFEGAKYVCTPPLRPREMQADIWRGLRTNDLQVVSTDHCPFCFKGQKEMGRDSFAKIPNGMPGVETRMYLLWDGGVLGGHISPNRFVEITSTAPAKIFGMHPRKGTVAVGSDADLLVWDPQAEHVLSHDTLHMRVDYSPFEGRKVRGRPTHVLSRGNVVVENGKHLGKAGDGHFLKRSSFSQPLASQPPMSSSDVRAKHAKYLFGCTANYYEESVVLAEGKGCYLTDLDGKKYLDFFGGILTVSVGHANAHVNEAVKAQMDRLGHVSTLYPTMPIVDLAEKLVDLTPGKLEKVFFTASGTEADETAVMMAQAHTGRQELIALRHGYSGRSLLAQSLTAHSNYRAVPTQVAAIKHGLSPYCYRCPLGKTPDSCGTACARDLEELIRTTTTGQIAGFLAEPIQGVGGFITPPKEYFQIAVEIVRKYGGLFIADEVQTGFGRTGGKMWGIEHYGVEPDMMTMAKGIANGMPIAATLCTTAIDASLRHGSISTFGGNPISATAALATLEEIEKHGLVENAARMGALLRSGLEDLQKRHPKTIGDVRGMGLMQAIELVVDETAHDRTPNPKATLALFEETKKRGLLIGKGGLYGNTVRIAPALNVGAGEIEDALQILRASFAAMGAG